MSINPGSDIVVDVMKAADPARAEQMAARLNALGAASPPDPAAFTQALIDTRGGASAAFSSGRAASLGTAAEAATSKAAKAQTSFESAIIDSFVKEMLPKDASDVYGQGEAGDVWRSMLSEQISNQIAKNGELGIAKKLFATHALHEKGKAESSIDSTARSGLVAAQSSANQLSVAQNGSIVDGSVLFKTKGAS